MLGKRSSTLRWEQVVGGRDETRDGCLDKQVFHCHLLGLAHGPSELRVCGCLFHTTPHEADNSNFLNVHSSISTARAQDGMLQTP